MSVSALVFLLLGPLWMTLAEAAILRLPAFQKKPVVPTTVLTILVVVGLQLLLLAAFEGPRFYRSATPFLYALVISTLGGHLYFHIFNMSESSRRIRLLRRLLQGHKLDTTADTYTPQEVYKIRLKRLQEWNQVAGNEQRLLPKATILSLSATILKALENLLFPER